MRTAINEDMFTTLEEDISHFQASGQIIVCGDLNARTGKVLDTLSPQGDKHLPGSVNLPSPLCPPRHNYDKATNRHGLQLLQLCRSLGLYIMNGRFRGDSYGRYTHSSSKGNSTVDYFITDVNRESIRAFTVNQLTPLSDHSKITAYLNRPTPNHEISKPNKLHTIRQRYKWREQSAEAYQNAIRHTQVQSLLDKFLKRTFLHTSENVNKAVKDLNNIFDLTASLANLKPSQR